MQSECDADGDVKLARSTKDSILIPFVTTSSLPQFANCCDRCAIFGPISSCRLPTFAAKRPQHQGTLLLSNFACYERNPTSSLKP